VIPFKRLAFRALDSLSFLALFLLSQTLFSRDTDSFIHRLTPSPPFSSFSLSFRPLLPLFHPHLLRLRSTSHLASSSQARSADYRRKIDFVPSSPYSSDLFLLLKLPASFRGSRRGCRSAGGTGGRKSLHFQQILESL
jgi:hypothetical protein